MMDDKLLDYGGRRYKLTIWSASAQRNKLRLAQLIAVLKGNKPERSHNLSAFA